LPAVFNANPDSRGDDVDDDDDEILQEDNEVSKFMN
jgi:hypothetical protein